MPLQDEENTDPHLPGAARVVIVGGGIAGASVAYHLTKLGWKDVLLLEQNQLAADAHLRAPYDPARGRILS